MYVDDQTFAKLLSDSRVFSFGETEARVVSARHLAALKIHALKFDQAHRRAKDYGDSLALLRLPETTLTLLELEELCSRFAGAQLFRKLKEDLDT